METSHGIGKELNVLLKVFGFVFDKLIGRLSSDKKTKARKLFLELIAVIVKSGAEGIAKGISKEIKDIL